jgi:transposase
MSMHSRSCSAGSTRSRKPYASDAKTVEHPFGTMKVRMGATHFLSKTPLNVAAEMALSVLAYNLTRALNIVGVKPLLATIAD